MQPTIKPNPRALAAFREAVQAADDVYRRVREGDTSIEIVDGSVRSDGISGVDLSVVKNISLIESLRLQFRAEFFNLTNTVRFAPPNTSFGSPAFGQVSAQSNQPRVVQFALKLIY